jgi:Uma2 family endonuclease
MPVGLEGAKGFLVSAVGGRAEQTLQDGAPTGFHSAARKLAAPCRQNGRKRFAISPSIRHDCTMFAMTIDLPAQEDQTEFNLLRWAQLTADTPLSRELSKFEGRIETDRHGHIIMSPPPGFSHGSYQLEIGSLLKGMLPGGRAVTECPISTADGVKAADVAWISKARLDEIGENVCLTKAPEICVEVLSPDNTRAEMEEKRALYFSAEAEEVWLCDRTGKMTFYCAADSNRDGASVRCPEFPRQIII